MRKTKPGDIDVERVVEFWRLEAEEALLVSDHLMEKRDYSYALFFGHLAVEKLLKAIYVTTHGKHAPPIHNLLVLAKSSDVHLDEEQTRVLAALMVYHIEARYPDLKREFRKRCTKSFAMEEMRKIKKVFAWLKSNLP